MTAGFRRLALVSVLLFGALTPATAAEWTEIVQKPLSPGMVALLVEHASESAVATRWSEALKDPRPEVRAAAARAIHVSRAGALRPDLARALAAETNFHAAAEEIEALAAVAGRAATEELQAAGRRDPRLEHAVSAALARGRKAAPEPPPSAPLTAWRTPQGLPPGLVPDLLKVSGCLPGDKQTFHGGQVSYAGDGRPREVTMLAPGQVPPACVAAVRALLFLDLAPAEGTSDAGHRDLVVVPLAPEAVACMGEALSPTPGASAPLRVGGEVKQPRTVRQVNPSYPRAALAEGVQGTVVVEALVAASGCVSSVKLLRSRDPRLDIASLITVAQWGYAPTLLDGVPAPVVLTVPVTFRRGGPPPRGPD